MINTNPSNAVFIITAPQDATFARRLAAAFKEQDFTPRLFGLATIPDRATWEKITRAIEEAVVVLFISSPAALQTEGMNHALSFARREQKWVVPVVYRDLPASAGQAGHQWTGFAGEMVSAADNWRFLQSLHPIRLNEDNLADALPQLLASLAANLPYARYQLELDARARQWQTAGQQQTLLLTGEELGRAEQWLAASTHRLPRATPAIQEYVAASRGKQQAALQRMLAGLVVLVFGPVLLFVCGLIIFGPALVPWEEEDDASGGPVYLNQASATPRPPAITAGPSPTPRPTRQPLPTMIPSPSEPPSPTPSHTPTRRPRPSSTPAGPAIALYDLRSADSDPPVEQREFEEAVAQVVWQPGGEHIAARDDIGSVYLWPVSDAIYIWELNARDPRGLYWSPDGRYLMVTSAQSLQAGLWDTANPDLVTAIEAPGASEVFWGPQSRRALIRGVTASGPEAGGHEWYLWELASNEARPLGEGPGSARLSPNGRQVAWWNAQNLRLYDSNTLAELDHYTPADATLGEIIWHPAGEGLLVWLGTDDEQQLNFWEPGGEGMVPIGPATAPVMEVHWRGEGPQFITRSVDNIVWWGDVETGHLEVLHDLREWPPSRRSGRLVVPLVISPSGQTAAMVDVGNTITLLPLDPNAPGKPRLLDRPTIDRQVPPALPRWHPELDYLLVSYRDGETAVWKAATGEKIYSAVPTDQTAAPLRHPASIWSDAGRFIVTWGNDEGLRVWALDELE